MRIYFSLILIFSLFVSCKFSDNPEVYGTFLEDKTLIAYFPFNGKDNDIKNEIFSKKGIISYGIDRFNKKGRSASFNGSSNYLAFGDILDSVFSQKNKAFSFSFWLKSDREMINSTIIGKSSDSNCNENERQFLIKISKNNQVQFIWGYSNENFNGYRIVEANKKLAPNNWYNIIITYNSSLKTKDGVTRLGIYVNGIPQEIELESKRGILGDIEDKKAHLSIGTLSNSFGKPCIASFFRGNLDDVLIFDRVISINEIKYINSFKN